jgi:hypothetical protein
MEGLGSEARNSCPKSCFSGPKPRNPSSEHKTLPSAARLSASKTHNSGSESKFSALKPECPSSESQISGSEPRNSDFEPQRFDSEPERSVSEPQRPGPKPEFRDSETERQGSETESPLLRLGFGRLAAGRAAGFACEALAEGVERAVERRALPGRAHVLVDEQPRHIRLAADGRVGVV